MEYTEEALAALAYPEAPPLDPDFLIYEARQKEAAAPALPSAIDERQRAYAQQCRDLYQRMTAEGARDYHLSQGIVKTWLSVRSSTDGYAIPVMQLDQKAHEGQEPDVVIVYYHGGGLAIGEADSEELSCRRMVKSAHGIVRLYSVGYRLKYPYGAKTCMTDSQDCFDKLRNTNGKTIMAGSSSGAQLAAAVSQSAAKGLIHGLLLRGPVTGDAHSGLEYIPEMFRRFHTSVSSSFLNSMSYYLVREEPRDGLDKLPVEADIAVLASQPRTWIQISTNDTLYSDGLCYTMALQKAGVETRLDVTHGWPHTFWLVAPELERSLKADEDMIEGLDWLAS